MGDIETSQINDYIRLGLLGKEDREIIKLIIDNITSGIFIFDVDDNDAIKMRYISNQGFNVIGISKKDYESGKVDVSGIIDNKDVEKITNKIARSSKTNTTFESIFKINTNKDYKWLHIKGIPLDSKYEGKALFVAFIDDITTMMNEYEAINRYNEVSEELNVSKQRYRILEETVEAILFEYNMASDVMIFTFNLPNNHEQKIISNYTSFLETNPIVHKSYLGKFKEAIAKACSEPIKDSMIYLSEIAGKGYRWYRVVYTSILDKNGNVTGVMGRIYDIEEDIQDTESRKELYKVDSMTGALEKHTGMNYVRKYLEKEYDKESYLVIVDIDGFRNINSQYGHTIGDICLKKFTQKAMEYTGESGKVIRYGGDEFIIFFVDINIESVEKSMKELEHGCNRISIKRDMEIALKFSYAIAGCQGKTLAQAFEEADGKMYEAKHK